MPWITKIKYKCKKCQKELAIYEKFVCDNCKENICYFNKIFSIFSYNLPIKKFLLELKFNRKLIYADFFGNILSSIASKEWYKYKAMPEILIPVPLHITRLRKRGFNQAFELSKPISKKIKVNNTACVRIKNTIKQTSLLKQNRKTNIKHAFSSEKLPYKHIAILDDVITTGSTINSLCMAIKKNNPDINIDVWCIARA